VKRPFVVTLFALLVLLFAAWNAWQILSAFLAYDLLRDLNLTTEANILIVMGATWAIGFGLAAWGLWRLRPWGRTWTRIVRLSLMRSSDEVIRRPADLFLALASIALVWAFLFWPRIRRLYRDNVLPEG
jgi:hypothetical protein